MAGFACTLLLAGSALAQQGLPQAPGSQTQPLPRREEPDPRLPTAREAERYDAPGVRAGSFLIFPELELDEAFNDNIYATSSATGKTASFIQLVKPSIQAKSQWNNHMLNAYANGGFSFYSADNSQNFQDVSVGADGRLDIQREWNVYGGGSWNRRHEELGTPNTVTGTFQPTIYNQLIGNVGYYQRFGRMKFRLDGRVDNYAYQNNNTGPAQGVLINTDRNRNEFREAARVGYEFLPGYEIWVRGSLNQRRYNGYTDSLGFVRNSDGWDVVGGVAIDFGGITSLEAFAGYLQQDYWDPRFTGVRAPTFGLTGYWNPMRELLVKPFVRRTIDDTALTIASAYVNTAFGVDVNYDMRPNIRIDGHADYSIADYQAITAGTGRYDQYYTVRIGLLYLPTPNFFVGPTYQFVHRSSNAFNSDYDQNLITLRLGARL
jgi:hypothetical protein